MFKRYFKKKNWHSWDPHPWNHPWLSIENLKKIKAFSDSFFELEKEILHKINPDNLRIAFCGNIANAMYVRAVPLIKSGLNINIFVHPNDSYIMSQPCWEEYDGVLPEGKTDFNELQDDGLEFPKVTGVVKHQPSSYSQWSTAYKNYKHQFLSSNDLSEYSGYLSNYNVLQDLQTFDVAWSTQSVYLPYLAKIPYISSQSGGDLWLEASRNDKHGKIMRESFAQSRVIVASNPWSFSHARRYGFQHMVYLPKIMDESIYSPGHGKYRDQWKCQSKGQFFVLTTSRLDEKNKGSKIGLDGFAQFARNNPEARLVFVGWGKNAVELESQLEEMGLTDKVIRMPVSGKVRLRDYLRSADVFMDQFVLGYFGSAGLEAMACGLPVVGRYEMQQYDALCETGAPPVFNCDSAELVNEKLNYLYKQPEKKKEVAAITREWFLNNHGAKRWIDEHKAILATTATGVRADFSKSPLCLPLCHEEKKYHNKGLKEAPDTLDYGW